MNRPSWIPRDAREVYCNAEGEPVAFCPVDSIGITDVERMAFYNMQSDRLQELSERAHVKAREGHRAHPEHDGKWAVVAIDVDDPTWGFLVDMLMPGNEAEWAARRARGERPVARGCVPQGLLEECVSEMYPAAGPPVDGHVNIFICAAGGISRIAGRLLVEEA